MERRAREHLVRRIAARKNPRTGRPYGRQRADAILNHASRRYVGRRGPLKEAYTDVEDVVHPIRASEGYDPEVERRHTLLERLDRALSKRGIRIPGSRYQEREERRRREEVEEELASVERRRLAGRGYGEVKDEILASGGISPDRDYPADTIPRDLRARPGRGLPPDEMAQIMGYEDAEEMLRDVRRRREAMERTGALKRA